ncbi:hypothetical protein GP486_007280 [Trichoglossum hirsutum]|uniref:WW domain-containing protein n=1 Tax=Trichoglossum hirsutum TaxID=265104 RepID=A0A9P8I6N3_9PEZI|nr:hypothetical protein GP486_007280 [Trichoglossum hirsutum]
MPAEEPPSAAVGGSRDEPRASSSVQSSVATSGEDGRSSENTGLRSQSPGDAKNANNQAPHAEEEDEPPPLPDEAPPSQAEEDDGWQALWDQNAQAYYFYNSRTGVTTWTNPRVPEASGAAATPGVGNYDRIPCPGDNKDDNDDDDDDGDDDGNNGNDDNDNNGDDGHHAPRKPRPHGGYDPSIHGDYDPTAPYAQFHEEATTVGSSDPGNIYTATGAFNRFTGKWQPLDVTPELHNDENKSRRQMSAFFDVDAAANSHDGRSLKAERSGRKLTKKELKAFKEKRREKKEEKRRAWLRD